MKRLQAIILSLLFENLGWKLGSLAIALVLWFVFIANEELTMTVPAVLQYRNTPNNMVLSSEVPDRVLLEVRGTSTRLQQFAESPSAVVLNLNTVPSSGERTFHLDPQTAQVPPGVELLRAIPSRVRVQLEPLATREVPVRVRTSGRPREGWRLSGSETTPKFVRIVGPASQVNRTEAVETDLVDLAGMNGYRELRMSVYVASPVIQVQPDTDVLVKIFIEPTESTEANQTTQ